MIITFIAIIIKTNMITVQSASGVRAGWVLGVSTLPHRSRQGGHWKVDDHHHHHSDVDDGDGEDGNDDNDNDGNPGTLATSLASARSPPPLSTYTSPKVIIIKIIIIIIIIIMTRRGDGRHPVFEQPTKVISRPPWISPSTWPLPRYFSNLILCISQICPFVILKFAPLYFSNLLLRILTCYRRLLPRFSTPPPSSNPPPSSPPSLCPPSWTEWKIRRWGGKREVSTRNPQEIHWKSCRIFWTGKVLKVKTSLGWFLEPGKTNWKLPFDSSCDPHRWCASPIDKCYEETHK